MKLPDFSGQVERYQQVKMVDEVDTHLSVIETNLSVLLPLSLLEFACYLSIKQLHSHREQFWGRAALAPVILLGSGRFYLRATPFYSASRGRISARVAAHRGTRGSRVSPCDFVRCLRIG